MRPDGVRIQALVWRTFTPAIVVAAIALGALVYTRLYDTILDGFSRKLVTTSALAGAIVDPKDHDWLIARARAGEAGAAATERDPRYVRNVEPLKAIRRDLGLTYLYSQVLGGSKGVIYVLDSSEGDEHSPIGAEDELPADTLAGLREVTGRGVIYASPIQYQAQWGLLKTAAAPLRGADGRIAATMGADVNISVIQVATQNALFASALIGVASLLACALATLAILRYVAQPIEGLKTDALRIAAGDRAPPQAMRAPREVTALRDALGELATKLIEAMRATRSDMQARDRAANLALLDTLLADEPAAIVLVDTPEALGVWVDAGPATAELRLRRRAMRGLAARIAATPGLAADWLALSEGAGTRLMLDKRTGTLTHVDGPSAGLTVDGAAVEAPVTLRPGQALAALAAEGPVAIAWERPR